MKTNIIIMGAGHTGTTILSRMYQEMGWGFSEIDPEYASRGELKWAVESNRAIVDQIVNAKKHKQKLDPADIDASSMVEGFRTCQWPQVIKDPRFVLTFPYLQRGILEVDNTLTMVHLTRNHTRVKQSYVKRGQFIDEARRIPGSNSFSVEQLMQLSKRRFSDFPGNKFSVSYEDIEYCVKHRELDRLAEILSGGLFDIRWEDAMEASEMFDLSRCKVGPNGTEAVTQYLADTKPGPIGAGEKTEKG